MLVQVINLIRVKLVGFVPSRGSMSLEVLVSIVLIRVHASSVYELLLLSIIVISMMSVLCMLILFYIAILGLIPLLLISLNHVHKLLMGDLPLILIRRAYDSLVNVLIRVVQVIIVGTVLLLVEGN